uniref:PQ loop repeat protein n=1 Tax=Pyramimonas orientalis virus TaxID=455367 RepID=A0A7L9AZ89_POV01|nr:hypothetical protein HWQ62_00509 [Pyramimonas orientalis virus]
MVLHIVDIIGYTGGLLLSLQMIPQIYKVFKTQSASDLSYIYLNMNLVGLQCMAAYGILQNDRPLYIPAAVSGLNTCALIMLKIVYDGNYSNRISTNDCVPV